MKMRNLFMTRPYKNIHEIEDERIDDSIASQLVGWEPLSRIEDERIKTDVKLKDLNHEKHQLQDKIEQAEKELYEINKIIEGMEAHKKAIEE